MGPPKQTSEKRPHPPADVSMPGTPSSAAPSTPVSDPVEPPQKKRKGTAKTAEEQTPLTPLQKARDMCQKCLKKKGDASNLALTLQSVPYADTLSKEMNNFAQKFEFLVNMWVGFVSAQHERSIPLNG